MSSPTPICLSVPSYKWPSSDRLTEWPLLHLYMPSNSSYYLLKSSPSLSEWMFIWMVLFLQLFCLYWNVLFIYAVLFRAILTNKLHIEDVKIVDHSMACCTLGQGGFLAAIVAIKCRKTHNVHKANWVNAFYLVDESGN